VKARGVVFSTAVASCWILLWPLFARASAVDPQTLASSLRRDPVQSIAVPRGSFTALSRAQVSSLRAEIGRFDLGRIWVMVVAPRSDSSLGSGADPVFGDLPAGTLIAVAEDPRDANVTNFWVGSTWKSSDAAQTQLNNVIDAYHHGQASLFDDLRLEIESFARSDAAAGHPALGSAGSAGSASAGGGSNAALIAVLIVAAILVLIGTVLAGGRLRGSLRASHRRREEIADAHARANTNLSKLAGQIEALDIDSSMPAASTKGKDEYAKALDDFEDAQRRLRRSRDAYQFEQAVQAINRGLEHVGNAERLFNSRRNAQQASSPTAPGPAAGARQRP